MIYWFDEMPVSAWKLHGASPFVDISGYSYSATTTSTARHAPLIPYVDEALVVSNASKMTTTSNVYGRGYESLPFSVEVAVMLIGNGTEPVQVWGRANEMDGITLSPNEVTFSTKYADGSEARCAAPVSGRQMLFVSVVHTEAKNMLYVNGQMVAEVEIDAEQNAAGYKSTGNSFSSGGSAGSNKVAMNGLSLYRYPLRFEAIEEHYSRASRVPDAEDYVEQRGGAASHLSTTYTEPVSEFSLDSFEDFMLGYAEGINIGEALDGGESGGSFEFVIPVPTDAGPIGYSTLYYEGDGAVAQVSTNGTNWTTVPNQSRVPLLTENTVPSQNYLLCRLLLEPEAYVDSLTVKFYGSTQSLDVGGRPVTLNNASAGGEFVPGVFDYSSGIILNNGSLTVSPPGEDQDPVRTIEIWSRGNLTDNITGHANKWVNGGGTGGYRSDEWTLTTYTFNTPYTGSIEISGTGQVGMIALFDYSLTAPQANQAMLGYFSSVTNVVDTFGNLALFDASEFVDLYQYDWFVVDAE